MLLHCLLQSSPDLKPVYQQPKYYTLNTRKSRSGSNDQSRMLSAYGVDRKSYESNQTLPRPDLPAKVSAHRWSTGGTTPTKTETSSRNCTRCSSVDVLESSEKVDKNREPRAKSVDPEVDSTALPPGKKPESGSHPEQATSQDGSKCLGSMVSMLTEFIRQEEGPSPPVRKLSSPKVVSPPVSNTTKEANVGALGKTHSIEVIPNRAIPLPRIISHASTPQESSDERPPIAPPRTKKEKRRTSSSSSSQVDDEDEITMIKVSDQELDRRALRNPPKHKPHAYEAIEITLGKEEQHRAKEPLHPKYDHLLTWKEEGSGDYDHLFPGKKGHKGGIRRKDGRSEKDSKTEITSGPLEEVVAEDSNHHLSPPGGRRGVRRNESLPPMRARSLTGESMNSTTDEQSGSSDPEEITIDTSPSPGTSSSVEGVVRRRWSKKSDEFDPFMDLLFAPPSKSRLRWSQELNPLYDYILGGKVSPAVGYDSTLAPTPENAVLEDDIQEAHPPEVNENGSLGSVSECSGDSQSYDNLVSFSRSAPNTLQRLPNRQVHTYEEVTIKENEPDERPRTNSKGSRPLSEHYHSTSKLPSATHGQELDLDCKSATLTTPVRRIKMGDSARVAISPRLGKRPVHRRSKTVRSSDDSNAPQRTQRAQRVANTMKVCVCLGLLRAIFSCSLFLKLAYCTKNTLIQFCLHQHVHTHTCMYM